MDHEDAAERAGDLFDPRAQLVFIGVTGEGIDRLNGRSNIVRLAEDIHFFWAGGEMRTERVRCAPANNEDSIAVVLNIVLDVMADTTRFGHAGGAEDDTRFLQIVECDRFLRSEE